MKEKIVFQDLTDYQMEIQIQDQLLRLLDGIPVLSNIDVYRSNNNDYDIEARANIDWSGNMHIICEVKSKAEPRQIRDIAHQMMAQKNYLEQEKTENVYYMVAAPYISQRSGDICKEMGIGYIDLSGNCMLKYKSIYIQVEGKPNKYKQTRGSRSIFQRSAVKSSIILRNLFQQLDKAWKIEELAQVSSASVGQVAKVKRFLEDQEYVIKESVGFKIGKPKEILDQWAKVYNANSNNVVECYSLDSTPQIEQKLAEMRAKHGLDCALTGYAGGVRYAPTVRYNKVHVYVPMQDLEEVVDTLGCKRVPSGSNISIIVPYDPCVLIGTREINGIVVASPVQVYLDLMGLKGRGEEAAQAVLEKEIL